jgi:hypothetical protein
MGIDQDALVAAIDLVGRSGARSVEIGYLHDDVPTTEAGWYCQCMFKGARIIVDNQRGPIEAAESLARRLLNGAQCRRCGEPIRLSDNDQGCRWTRKGPKWEPGCGQEINQSIPRRR